ncbi:MAG: hypothetical protein KF777_22175 [Planctomycetaceae bacterium]|nr:hypothetical protein [Planctomycetaceae bacterium]
MPRKRIIHETTYHYNQPVTFGVHRALMRPREGHDVHIVSARIELEPRANIRWLRDIEGNSVAILTFEEQGSKLRLLSEIDVDLNDEKTIECLIDPQAKSFPFQYSPDEQIELVPLRFRRPPTEFSGSERHTPEKQG